MAMTLRLSEDQTNRLRDAAEREGLSMQALVVKAVDEYVTGRASQRQELLERILAEDAGLLRRLADA